MIQMISTFDKEVQKQFYKNLTDAMIQYDNMQSKFKFQPEIIALNDKFNIKEIMIDIEATKEKQSADKDDMKEDMANSDGETLDTESN